MIGKVVDTSALAAIARGDLEATAWLETAHATATSLYVPALAFAEVLALRPDAAADLDDARTYPSIIVRDMNSTERPLWSSCSPTPVEGPKACSTSWPVTSCTWRPRAGGRS